MEKGVMVIILAAIIFIGIIIFNTQFDYNQTVVEIKRPPVKEATSRVDRDSIRPACVSAAIKQ